MAVMRPELIMKSIIPVVMAGILGIYGLVVAALIANEIASGYTLQKFVLFIINCCLTLNNLNQIVR